MKSIGILNNVLLAKINSQAGPGNQFQVLGLDNRPRIDAGSLGAQSGLGVEDFTIYDTKVVPDDNTVNIRQVSVNFLASFGTVLSYVAPGLSGLSQDQLRSTIFNALNQSAGKVQEGPGDENGNERFMFVMGSTNATFRKRPPVCLR